MAQNDNIGTLHGLLQKAGYNDIGTEDKFRAYVSDANNARKLHGLLQNSGYNDIGDENAFLNYLGISQQPKQTVTQPTQQAPSQTERTRQQNQQPMMDLPSGFGELDINQANRMSLGRGPVSWDAGNQVVQQPTGTVAVSPQTGKPIDKSEQNKKQKEAETKQRESYGGMTHDELEYMTATGKPLQSIVPNKFTAPTVARDENGQMILGDDFKPLVGSTTDQTRVAQYQKQERERQDKIRKQIVNSAVDKLQRDMETKARDLTIPSGMMAGGQQQSMLNQTELLRRMNQADSPESLLRLLNETYGYEDADSRSRRDEELRSQGKSVVLAHWDDDKKNEDFINRFIIDNQDAIESAAAQTGVPVDDYVWNELIPNLSNDIAERFGQNMTEKYSVKNTADYLAKRWINSSVGAIARLGTMTPMQSQYLQQELQKSNEGEGKYFNASWNDKAIGEIAQFLPDAPLMMVGGFAGGAATKSIGAGLKKLGAESLGTLVSTGSPFLAANVGKATKYSGQLLNMAVGGSANMGTFMGISNILQTAAILDSAEDGYWSSIGMAGAEGVMEGVKIGIALGALGTAGRKLSSMSSTAKGRAAIAAGSFLAENQIFALSDYLEDPERFKWVDSSLDAFYMMMAGRVSGITSHGTEGIKHSFKNILYGEPMKNMPRLTDEERSIIQQSFDGMDFTEISADMNNLGKILSDKENIPLTIRQKLSGATMGVFEPNRPLTHISNIRGNSIYERAKPTAENPKGELLAIHTFKDENERDQIMQQIAERKANDEMVSYYNILNMRRNAVPDRKQLENAKAEILREMKAADKNFDARTLDEGGINHQLVIDRATENSNHARTVIEGFANEYDMGAKDVMDIMAKSPIDRSNEEADMMKELSKRLHDAAFPDGELHQNQSSLDGSDLAGDGPVTNPDTNAQLAAEIDKATEEYNNFLATHGDVKEGLDYMQSMRSDPMRADEMIMYIDQNFSGESHDEGVRVVANYFNALAKKEAYISKVGQNIDGFVESEIDRNGFKGSIDGAPDSENIITISDGENSYTLLNGDVATAMTEAGRVMDSEKSGGMIIARDQNGEFVSLKPDSRYTISEIMTKEDYGNNLREELEIENTASIVDSGLAKGEEASSPSSEGYLTEAPRPDGSDLVPTSDNASVGSLHPTAQVEERVPLNDSNDLTNPDNGAARLGINSSAISVGKDTEISEAVQENQQKIAEVTDKDGVKRYENGIDIDTAIADIQNDGLDVNETADLAISEAQTELDKIKTPKTRAEQVKGASKRKALQSTIDYYTQMKERLDELNREEIVNVEPQQPVTEEKTVTSQPRPNAEEKKQARIAALKEELGELFDDDFTKANDASELVSMWTSRGRELAWDDVDGKRGLQSELFGWTRKIGGDTRFIEGLLAKKGEGMGVDEFVHMVWESPENDVNGEKRFSTEEIKEALLDLLKSAQSKSDVVDYAVNTREAQARKALEEERMREEEETAEEKKSEPMTDEEWNRIGEELPFDRPSEDDAAETRASQLEQTARELMNEEGAPNIEVIDTERTSQDQWRKMAEDDAEGAYLSDEEVDRFKDRCMEEGIFFNEETGKITVMRVFSENVTPEQLREAVELYKEYRNGDLRNEERRDEAEAPLVQGGEEGVHTGDTRREEAEGDGRQGEGSPESEPVADYLLPRNEEERQAVADVEAQLNGDIEAAAEDVRKARAALERAQAKESDRATDMFSDDEAFEAPDQIFSFDEMGGTDRSQEGIDRRTASERESLQEAESRLERLQSDAERNSRVRGALDNMRRQKVIGDETEQPQQTTDTANPMEAIERNAEAFRREQNKTLFSEEKLNNERKENDSEKEDVSLRTEREKQNEPREVESPNKEGDRINEGNERAADIIKECSVEPDENGRGGRSKQRLLEKLEESTRNSGQWIEDFESTVGTELQTGGENEVYLSKDGNDVVKLNNLNFLREDATNFEDFLNRLESHNSLFPDVPLHVDGFAKNSKGETCIVLRQPLVKNAREATEEEIDAFLEDMDFYTDISGNWTDGRYEIGDLKPNNVLVDEDGNLHFIDVVTYDSNLPGKMMKARKPETRFKEGDGIASRPEHERKIADAIEKTAKKLNTPVKIITSIDDVTNKDAAQALRDGRAIRGWFDESTGEIAVYLPNISDRYVGEQTVAHEVVGHHGLRKLLGEKAFRTYMRTLALDLKDESLGKYLRENMARNGFDIYRTIDEFLAEAAEKGHGELSMWMKVRDAMTDALRKVGFKMSPSISDVKYMVWLSENQLKKGEPMSEVKREALLYKLGKERYEAKVENGEYTFGEKSDRPSPYVGQAYFPGQGRTLFSSTPSAKTSKHIYEKALRSLGYYWKEAHVDDMQAGVELMRAISGVRKIEDIPAVENFVLASNQMSSKETQAQFQFNRDYMEPLTKTVSRILPNMGRNRDEALRNLQLYTVEKHGLENNRRMFVRDKIREFRKDEAMNQNDVDKLESDYQDIVDAGRDELSKGKINMRQYLGRLDDFIQKKIDKDYKPGKRDYSGLSSVAPKGRGYDDSAIIGEVMSTESKIGKALIDELHERRKEIAHFAIEMEYQGGLISKETRDKVLKMSEWYVPLRGYDEKTSDEVYDYINERESSELVAPVLMNAKGHKHMSDVDVFATMGKMATDAIHRSLQNQVKQSFARFVRNHYQKDGDDRLVTELKYLWGENVGKDAQGNAIWEERLPDIPEGATADDIARIVKDFEADMLAKEKTGDAKRIKQNSTIPFRVPDKNKENQHIVKVFINGEQKTFIINGNPRAAQAINGMLKSESKSGAIKKAVRIMAQLNTSFNPDFIVGNTERDLIFAASAIGIKENGKYWGKWVANYFTSVAGREALGVPMNNRFGNLFRLYREDKLDMSNDTDRYFKEFMENGAETGFVERKNLDKWKKEIRKGVRIKGKPEQIGMAVVNALPKAIEMMNERAENMARFATYMTSRQMGRSITRSVSDAKEVSVNFNRKGSGLKTAGLTKQERNPLRRMNAIVAARTAQFGQDYLMFYNAGVQGLNNSAKLFKYNPIKASAVFSGFALGGMLIPWINQQLIDDEDPKDRGGISDPYAELPEWIRRNRLCFYIGGGEFATVDLPIELRALYGIGDLAAGYTINPNLKSDMPVWEDVLTQMTQILPVDFMGSYPGNPLMNFVPSAARPLAEILLNVDWTGRKIERDQYIDKNDPRWMRAYSGTNKAYIAASKLLNASSNEYSKDDLRALGVAEEDLPEADASMKSKIWDGYLTDPAYLEHIVEGYTGGLGQTIGRAAHIGMSLVEGESFGELFKGDKMPVARRFHYSPTEKNKMARTRNRWFKYVEEMESVNNEVKKLKKFGVHDPLSKIEEIELENSARATRARMMKDAEKQYRKLKKKQDKFVSLSTDMKLSEEERKAYADDVEDMQMRMDQLMENTVRGLDNIGGE